MLIGSSVNHREGTPRIADACGNAVIEASGGAVAADAVVAASFEQIANETALLERVKALHKKIISIDSHCDTPMLLNEGIDIGKKNKQTKTDVIKMQEGMLDAVFMAAYIRQGALTLNASRQATEKAVSIFDRIQKQIKNQPAIVAQAYAVADIKKNKAEGKKSILLGLENGYALGENLDNIKLFADLGVKYITLSHNGDNAICDGNAGKSKHGGLSEFGKQVVKEMNRQGLIVDISHTSEKTSFDVLEISSRPVIASHSSVKALCDHPRNLSDKLIKAIAQKGGVIQICLYKRFLRKSGVASLKDAVDHIDYVVRLVGIDYVGIGSDFDGDGGISGLQATNDFPQLTMELIRRGYSDADIAKIWGGNLMRVMEAAASKK